MTIDPLALAPTKVHITTSEGFLALARESKGRNQGPSQRCLRNLDPDGYHVAVWRFLHNDVEWRVKWAVKLVDRDEPVYVLMDNSLEAFDAYTSVHEYA